uniref:Uncharacterized protein n=1 Tax=Mandrillus leucophaeus TaxID=9568 RepID=A0A2K5XG75_MANLE
MLSVIFCAYVNWTSIISFFHLQQYSNIVFVSTLHLYLHAELFNFRSTISFGRRSWLKRQVAGKYSCAAHSVNNQPASRVHVHCDESLNTNVFPWCPQFLAHSRNFVNVCWVNEVSSTTGRRP